MDRDILGNEISDSDLEVFEQSQDEGQSQDQESKVTDDTNYSVVEQLESNGEVDVSYEDQQLSRKEKKKQRGERLWRENIERARAADSARLEAEKRAELAEQRLRMLETQRIPVTEQQDGLDDELERLHEEQDRLYEAHYAKLENGKATSEDIAKFKKDARKLQSSITQKIVDQRIKSQPQPNVGEQALQTQLSIQYPEVFSDQRALAYARGLFQMKIASGEANSMNTVHKTMKETMDRFRYGRESYDSDDGTKRRLQGTGRGTIGKSSEATPTIKITPAILKMANAAYPNLSTEEERIKHWIKVNGKNFAELQKNS